MADNVLPLRRGNELQGVTAKKVSPAEAARIKANYQALMPLVSWNTTKLKAAIEKRTSTYVGKFFPDDGFQFTIHFDGRQAYFGKKAEEKHIRIRVQLAPDAKSWSAYVFLAIGSVEVPLHKPLSVLLRASLKDQADTISQAFHTLHDGLIMIVGVDKLPLWPSEAQIRLIQDHNAVRAAHTLNEIRTNPKRPQRVNLSKVAKLAD